MLLASRYTLQQNAISDSYTVWKCTADSQRGEHPALYRVVIDYLRIGDIIFIAVLDVTVDEDAKHIEYSILVTHKRVSVELVTTYYMVVLP